MSTEEIRRVRWVGLAVIALIFFCIAVTICAISIAPLRAISAGLPPPNGWSLPRLIAVVAILLGIMFAGIYVILRDLLTTFTAVGLVRWAPFAKRLHPWSDLISYSLQYPVLILNFNSRVERVNVLSVADINELQAFLQSVKR